MKESNRYHHKARRGGILISALAFVTVTSMLMIGMLTLSVSFYARAKTEADYESALALAEAGANYELRKISTNSATADQAGVASPPGVSYSLGGGIFKVYCTNKDGSTPWIPPNNLYIMSTGTINGVSRQVRVSIKGSTSSGDYAVFAVHDGTLSDDPSKFTGNIGTNGTIDASQARPTVTGTFSFNGATSNWLNNNPNGYASVHNPNPVNWPTVNQIADNNYPTTGAGVNYFATHNNNAARGLGTTLNSATTLTAGDYYFTSINLASGNLVFDNRNGPVNIWVGPSGAAGAVNLSGGSSMVALSSNPNVHLYVGTRGTVHLFGTTQIDIGIYAYNKDTANGVAYGAVLTDDWPKINGQVLANTVNFTSNVTVTSVHGLFFTSDVNYYGYDDSWLELNGM